jgi:hypothetical protein
VTAEKKLHLEISQNSRREFFKNAGKLGLGIGIGGGLISPLAASALESDEAAYKDQTIKKSKAVRKWKSANSLPCFIRLIFIHSLIFMMNFLLRIKKLYIKKGAVCCAENNDQ